jgi:hypothetical protein
MGGRRNARIVAACACVAVAVAASALVRRAGAAQMSADPSREAFLEERRERMRVASAELLGSRSAGAP